MGPSAIPPLIAHSDTVYYMVYITDRFVGSVWSVWMGRSLCMVTAITNLCRNSLGLQYKGSHPVHSMHVCCRTEAVLLYQDTDMEWATQDEVSAAIEEEESFLQQHNLTRSSLQRLKEESLGTREGMGKFVDFLQDTLGSYLLHFWMDCEEFKECSIDLEANYSPVEARHRSVHLFRCIQGKYQVCLSPECQEQIRVSQQNWGPTFHALKRPQYDALRRLRSYWVPRFLIHQQRYLLG
ncbi:hypothetical protein FKM82_026966 [Ascaphus truei]